MSHFCFNGKLALGDLRKKRNYLYICFPRWKPVAPRTIGAPAGGEINPLVSIQVEARKVVKPIAVQSSIIFAVVTFPFKITRT